MRMSAGSDPIRDDSEWVRPTLTLVKSDGRKKQWTFCACGELALVTVSHEPLCPGHFISKVRGLSLRMARTENIVRGG